MTLCKEHMKTGIVYLVGAGPGDPGLMTVRGRELLGKAEVVVYDYLANPVFLEDVQPDCEVIYVGKRGRSERLPQTEINAVLVERAKAGKCVLRLKGGDPCIFGRGGEEAEYLLNAGVRFEIVPGVTAGIGVAAYAGIPLTHRDYAGDVTFVSGHEAEDDAGSHVNWADLAERSGTLVVYMGITAIDEICQKLMKGGKSAETPAAVIRWGTTAEQRTIVTRLGEMAQAVGRADLKPPAILIVGDVVTLREKLAWFEKKPLFGKRVLLARARGQTAASSALFQSQGADVVSFSTIEIVPPPDYDALDKSIARRADYDWLVFTSANAVAAFFERLAVLSLDSRALGHLKIAAIGEKTTQALTTFGIRADRAPNADSQVYDQAYNQEGLLKALEDAQIAGKSVWLPTALRTRAVLRDGLVRLGCRVDQVPVYATRCPTAPAIDGASLRPDWIVFTSASTVENFFTLVGEKTVAEMLGRGAKIACIGPITRAAVLQLEKPCHVMPERATMEALVEAIVRYTVLSSSSIRCA